MKTKAVASYMGSHQVVVFWLGVLTGALVVGFAFFYGMLRMNQYQTAIYRANLVSPTYSTTLTKTTLTTPTATTTAVPLVNTQSYGGEGGGY
jgi:glycerol-3-phosphate acyltransferase PlsY